ncbi:hypothetical protein [Cytobacillus firmus]|uniref:hypothetical protein n=1 Tax=Cytobacillus firmus TaxID=1399 RepID=UPI001C8E10BD|nr:hypothetical protein [Cytobacillus firmus]MBX9972595.1 hypothetical protein [Cytobacillus firmus]
MGNGKFSCEELALPEIRERLEEFEADTTPPVVALLGDNNNVLGIGTVEEVNMATVRLELSILGIDIAEFFVNLCCVCSIVSAPTEAALQDLLRRLGIVP